MASNKTYSTHSRPIMIALMWLCVIDLPFSFLILMRSTTSLYALRRIASNQQQYNSEYKSKDFHLLYIWDTRMFIRCISYKEHLYSKISMLTIKIGILPITFQRREGDSTKPYPTPLFDPYSPRFDPPSPLFYPIPLLYTPIPL